MSGLVLYKIILMNLIVYQLTLKLHPNRDVKDVKKFTRNRKAMTHKLINRASGEQHLCDKVTIDGFDYYVSDEKIHFGYVWNIILEQIETMFKEKTFHDDLKGVIATNNPNIDVPKVVDEVEMLAKKTWGKSLFTKGHRIGFIAGYNKSQKTHPFSEDDVKEIFKIAQMQKNYGDYKPYTFEEAIQLFWKEQQPKTVYYV